MDDMASLPLSDARSAGGHRPKFWRWAKLSERGSLREIAEALDVSHNTIFLLMLPWADPRRLSPNEDLITKIANLSAGEITAADWVPPAAPATVPAQQDGWAQ